MALAGHPNISPADDGVWANERGVGEMVAWYVGEQSWLSRYGPCSRVVYFSPSLQWLLHSVSILLSEESEDMSRHGHSAYTPKLVDIPISNLHLHSRRAVFSLQQNAQFIKRSLFKTRKSSRLIKPSLSTRLILHKQAAPHSHQRRS
jgi:hypothetical protein